ncbi:hypothetical protein GGI21_006303, partial [Coemansia aciculifera]
YMRLFKRSGDAEHEPPGKKELELGYYLESLACCLEDFWSRKAFSSADEMKKKWPTMLGMCKHLYRESSTPKQSALRGCAALIISCVSYRISLAGLEAAGQEPGAAAAAAAGLGSDVARALADMEKYEQSYRQALSAFELSQQFPKTWVRCQGSSATAAATYEPRSHPVASKWPSVAYPVGATSNPMDVANFVRQVGCEWLEHSKLSLKVTKAD